MVSVVRSGPNRVSTAHPGARPGAGRAEELDGTGVGHPLGVAIEAARLFPRSRPAPVPSSAAGVPSAPMVSARAGRWLRRLLAIALVLAVVVLVAATWIYTSQVDGLLLRSDHGLPTYDIEVLAVSDGEVTLPAAPGRPPGTWGLEWETGYARVGPVAATSEDGVVRPLLEVAGDLRPGLLVALDAYAYESDPSAVGLEFENVIVEGALGNYPAWYTPGDGRHLGDPGARPGRLPARGAAGAACPRRRRVPHPHHHLPQRPRGPRGWRALRPGRPGVGGPAGGGGVRRRGGGRRRGPVRLGHGRHRRRHVPPRVPSRRAWWPAWSSMRPCSTRGRWSMPTPTRTTSPASSWAGPRAWPPCAGGWTGGR